MTRMLQDLKKSLRGAFRFKYPSGYIALVSMLGLGDFGAHAEISGIINFQGKITTLQSNLLNGNYSISFRLYETPANGTILWQETHTNLAIARGVFAASLGLYSPLNLPFDKTYWISVEVQGDGEMLPRQRLTSSPYAFHSKASESAANLSLGGINGDLLVYQNGWKRLPAAPEAGMVLVSQAAGAPPVWVNPSAIQTSTFYTAIGGSGGAGYDSFADVSGTSFVLPSGGPFRLGWHMEGSFLRRGGWEGSEGGRARAAVGSLTNFAASPLGTAFNISGEFTNAAGGSVFRMQASGGWDNTQFGNPQTGTLGPTPTKIWLWWKKE